MLGLRHTDDTVVVSGVGSVSSYIAIGSRPDYGKLRDSWQVSALGSAAASERAQFAEFG